MPALAEIIHKFTITSLFDYEGKNYSHEYMEHGTNLQNLKYHSTALKDRHATLNIKPPPNVVYFYIPVGLYARDH